MTTDEAMRKIEKARAALAAIDRQVDKCIRTFQGEKNVTS